MPVRREQEPPLGESATVLSQPQRFRATALLRDADAPLRAHVANTRLIECVSELPPGNALSLVLTGKGDGRVVIDLLNHTSCLDLTEEIAWASRDVIEWDCTVGEGEPFVAGSAVEVRPAAFVDSVQLTPFDTAFDAGAREDRQPAPTIMASRAVSGRSGPLLWPQPRLSDGVELLEILRLVEGQIRVHIGAASALEHSMVWDMVTSAQLGADATALSAYIGRPVRIRMVVGQARGAVSPRLRAAVRRLGLGLEFVDLDLADSRDRRLWDGDASALEGAAQPLGVALTLLRLPAAPAQSVICGVPTKEPGPRIVPLATDLGDCGLRVGRALDTTGTPVPVRLGPDDLLRHLQVMGASGSGKSSFLAALVGAAAGAGYGVTVLDPHGSLVTRCLGELPASAFDRARVVRSGDLERVVPINAVSRTGPAMQRETMLTVLRELLDPGNYGFMGPRFERINSICLDAADAIFGDRGGLSVVPLLLTDQKMVRRVATALARSSQALSRQFMTEFGELDASTFADLAGWAKAKYQRLIGTEHMRRILGSGRDVIDVARVIDDGEVLFVDLASTTIGATSAQLLGEMWLTKHWSAMERRRDHARPHVLVVDECHLFGSGLLPRILAEGRKYGIAVVLAHQHLQQLSPALAGAATANASSFVCFRTGVREAADAAYRLGSWSGELLTRLPNLQAAVTLSLEHRQSDPFTLVVDHNELLVDPVEVMAARAEAITAASDRILVAPHRGSEPITLRDIEWWLEQSGRAGRTAEPGGHRGVRPPDEPCPHDVRVIESSGSTFLDEWLAKRMSKQLSGSASVTDVGDEDADADDSST